MERKTERKKYLDFFITRVLSFCDGLCVLCSAIFCTASNSSSTTSKIAYFFKVHGIEMVSFYSSVQYTNVTLEKFNHDYNTPACWNYTLPYSINLEHTELYFNLF